MSAEQTLPKRIEAALSEARTQEARIAELHAANDQDGAQDAIIALEKAAIDLFSTFEARMQHHFKRGPFSRKLKARLIEAGQTELADKLHQFYLAINVLKHGKGASHRELLALSNTMIAVRASDDAQQPHLSLIDVTSEGFSEGLCTTLQDAYHFLQS